MSNPLSRAFAGDIEIRSGGDGRTIHGIVVPFGKVARVRDGWGPSYEEAFEQGAFAKTIRERGSKVKLLSQHDAHRNPLGKAVELQEQSSGLFGEFYVSKTRAGDEALELVRDGALDSFSVGFTPVKEAKRGKVTWRTEVGLRESSLVTFPAYEDALIGGVRSWDDLSEEDRDAFLRRLFEMSHDLGSTTPDGEPETAETSTDEVRAEEEPTTGIEVAHSVPHRYRHLRAMAREKGIL